ncbi:MAG: hypothetical protein K2X82_08685, partial [Gemmataceae bacterium]|nr:hypothetical protein [Gemmataceae bacterium]
FCPQGTLAERLRAGGAGIPAFYTPTRRDPRPPELPRRLVGSGRRLLRPRCARQVHDAPVPGGRGRVPTRPPSDRVPAVRFLGSIRPDRRRACPHRSLERGPRLGDGPARLRAGRGDGRRRPLARAGGVRRRTVRAPTRLLVRGVRGGLAEVSGRP